jgi:hypothetical protein
MQTTINTVLALLKATMTTALETNTAGVDAGTYHITLPGGVTGQALSGTATITGSPVTLVSGDNLITVTGTGSITVILNGSGIIGGFTPQGGGIGVFLDILFPDPNATDYFVKTWYTNDPLAQASMDTPSGAVIASLPSSRSDVFVGEDSVFETLKIRFYQVAARKSSEAAEVAAGMTRLIAMFEEASLLLRTDPTFGSTFVYSKITSIEPLVMGVSEANSVRVCEITFETLSRKLWGQ